MGLLDKPKEGRKQLEIETERRWRRSLHSQGHSTLQKKKTVMVKLLYVYHINIVTINTVYTTYAQEFVTGQSVLLLPIV